ncbi:hypothetical protein AYI68_g4655 [Smittium mucronatum]|uniref:Uncharacterized protein n=1 Tax=Smittium mucronatum TaxID=133383 RepID=A0A1R0GWG9_9FUNG|nr:hypothetical protein AYI68_g4655 [Smittium mucronatum]
MAVGETFQRTEKHVRFSNENVIHYTYSASLYNRSRTPKRKSVPLTEKKQQVLKSNWFKCDFVSPLKTV